MSCRMSPLRVGLAAGMTLLLIAGQVAASVQAIGGATADAPPNTERTTPASPPSDAVIERLIAASATVPQTAPSTRTELSDTVQQAYFASGSADLTPLAIAKLDAFVTSLRGAQVRRALVTAHTDAQRLVREAKRRFVTNQRLSEARAASVVEYLRTALALPEDVFAIEGFGARRPVADNGSDAGRARNRRAEVSVWLEVPALPKASEAPGPEPPSLVASSSCIGDAANQLAPVRITVDGVPLDRREGTNEADRQRCVDVALARADIQVRYDPLEQQPFLNVIAIPQTGVVGKPVRFTSYTNYPRYIDHAEMRLFAADQSVQQTPLQIIPITAGQSAEWVPPAWRRSLLHLTTSLEKPHFVSYVLRVYDRAGHFDETRPRRLDLTDTAPVQRPDAATLARDTERLAYGENTLVLHNIPTRGGAVTVSGSHVPVGDTVLVQGIPIPVDDDQHFVARQILPGGPQQVSVKILNDRGEGLDFTRNLAIATDDSFFVGLADFTAGARSISGPIELVSGESPDQTRRDFVNGQLAFYYKGLVKGEWLLTAAADTKDEPVRDLFSNFASKDPQDLLRRIDPNRYYPVYGDDSTTVQDAPTSGKFYIRLEKGDSSVLWGDFQTRLTGTDFIQYSRTLYGLSIRYRSPDTTSLGEKTRSVDAFWADPGTLNSRQEFRGTGGSLYYLQNQDISVGSEQVWTEVRDRDSGLVLSVTQLVPAQDYDINYLQGRILLRSPLSATANSTTVVHGGGLDGDAVYLVVTYEYVPDFSSPSTLALGGHASEWFGDHVQLGISGYHQGDPGQEQDLRGVNGTLRYMPGTYIKSEYAHSDGTGSTTLTSITGGLSFNSLTTAGGPANAERVEAAVDLAEVTDSLKGRANVYYQDRDANFSGPGQLTPGVGMRQYGAAMSVPINASTQIAGKIDSTDSTEQTLRSGELGIEHKLDDHWRVAVGARLDDQENVVPNASPILSQNGRRTDVALTVGYQPTPGVVTPVIGATIRPVAGSPAPVANNSASVPGTMTGAAAGAVTGAAAVPGAATGAVTGVSTLPGAAIGAGTTVPGTAGVPGAAAGANPVSVATVSMPVSGTATSPGTATGPGPGSQSAAIVKRPAWDVYGFVQDTTEHTETRPDNDRAGLGGSYQISDALRVGAEASDGSLGVGAKVSTDYHIDDRSNVYLNYTLAADQPDALNIGRDGMLTAGTRYRYDDATSVYGEERLMTGTGSDSLTRAYGVDFSPTKHWTYGLKFEHGTISDPINGDLALSAVTATLDYSREKIKYSAALEWREDNSSVTGASRTVLTRNSLTYQIAVDWRIFGKLNWSQTDGAADSTLLAAYHEVVVGAAWRPVRNDRWNTLFKFTILEDQPSIAQINSAGNTLDYAQQSQVFDIDTTYQATSWFSLGAKYAIRTGELKSTVAGSDWYASQAQLWIARGDFLLPRKWDGMLELRRLEIHETDDHRTGCLLGLYRHLGDHLKVGAGYNFTNYSDNLTDLSYRSHGFFINTIGKF
jgi:outer membrane protein OmpA-like peptidoglycan-associated protein